MDPGPPTAAHRQAAGIDTLEKTRRSVLAWAGLAGAGVGILSMAVVKPALANHPLQPGDFAGFNNVKTALPGVTQGAAGDGVTPDKTAIQAWIDASAGPNPSHPGTIYFPPGTYLIEGTLRLPSNSILVGHGPLSVIKATDGPSGFYLMVHNNTDPGNSDIVIEDLTLDGNKEARHDTDGVPVAGGLIRIDNCQRVWIRRLIGFDSPGVGASSIFLTSVTGGAVENCFLRDGNKDGITVADNCADLLVRGNLVQNHVDDEIAVFKSTRITVAGNVCVKTEIKNTGVGRDLLDNRLFPRKIAGAPIALRGASHTAVLENVCRGGVEGGIVVMSGWDTTEDVAVANNLVLEAGNVTNLTPAPWNGGLAGYPNRGSGIVVKAVGNPLTVRRVRVAGNLISAPGNNGVTVALVLAGPPLPASSIAVTDNVIQIDHGVAYLSGNGAGIACELPQVEISDLTIEGNRLADTRGPGISVRGTYDGGGATKKAVKRVDVRHNQVLNAGTGNTQGAAQPGILIEAVDDATIVKNRAYDSRSQKTQEYGLRLKNVSGRVAVLANVLLGNLGAEHGGTVKYEVGTPNTGPAALVLRDNPGYSPWTGVEANLSGWSGGAPSSMERDVTFGTPFASPPAVLCTVRPVGTEDLDAYAVAENLTTTGFRLKVIASAAPVTSAHQVVWVAVPSS